MNRNCKTIYPSHNVIGSAIVGDIKAISEIVKYYKNYIIELASYTYYDEHNHIHKDIDQAMFDELVNHLIEGIIKFE